MTDCLETAGKMDIVGLLSVSGFREPVQNLLVVEVLISELFLNTFHSVFANILKNLLNLSLSWSIFE